MAKKTVKKAKKKVNKKVNNKKSLGPEPPQGILERIKRKVQISVAASLGLNENQIDQLTDSITEAIDEELNRSASFDLRDLIGTSVKRELRPELRQGVEPIEIIGSRLKNIREGIQGVAGNPDVEAITKQNASLLKMKYDALKEVHFNDVQAFEILLAELKRPRR